MALQTKFGNSLPHWKGKKLGKKNKTPQIVFVEEKKKALEAVNGDDKSIPP